MTRTARRLMLMCCVVGLGLRAPHATWAQEGSDGPATPPSPRAAAPIFDARCANCHGPTGQGGGPQAIEANLPVPDLTDLARLRQTTPARWFDIISQGVDGAAMPPFGERSSNPLRQVERWDLVYYLYTLSTPEAQVAMGQALYERSCVECHEGDGTGGPEAPGFTDLRAMVARSQADLFAAITDATIQGHDVGIGEVEAWTLADYVRTFSYNYGAPSVADAASAVDAPSAANPFSGGAGVVTGRVINGSSGAATPQELVIRLRAFDMDANFIDVITTTTAADGSFRFEGIDPTLPVQLEPMTIYQNITYFGELDTAIVLSPEQPQADANIEVYETSEDDSAIRVERLHIVFDFVPDRAQVAELYILSNDSDRTYVGTLEAGTIRLTVPADALEFQPGGDPNRYLTLADGIADTVPIRPGQSTAESILVYELAYDDGLELSRPMPYDVNNISIFLPADIGIEIGGEGVERGNLFQAQGTALDTYTAGNRSASESLMLRLSGEPQVSPSVSDVSPHEPSGPNKTQSIAVGAIVLAGAVVLAALYWQGHLSVTLRTAPHDRTLDLLQAVADLDDDFASGHLGEKSYRAKRARLKDEIIELMEVDS